MTTMEMTFAPAAVGTIGQDRAVATLTAAFCADPVIRWVFPQPRACLRACPELANLVAGDAFAAGTVEVAPGYAGVAMWLGPDAPSDDDALGALLESSVDEARAEAVFALLTQMIDHHPTEPAWYLPFVGVDPALQGLGIGTGLISAGLARADADRLPAYLEASTPRNRSPHDRLGFEVVSEIRAADSPPLWPMLRPARGAR